jgi:1,4-alpha-glucan branching enzyme
MKTTVIFVIMFFALLALPAFPQKFNPDNVCRIDNGKLIFTLNLKWTAKEKKELSDLFDLDSILIDQVYKGKTNITIDGENWQVRKLQGNMAELSKAINTGAEKRINMNDLLLMVDKWSNFAGSENESAAIFGVNNFTVANAFVYSNPIARFYLPGFKSASKIYISGTFNKWSTTQTPMKFVGTGWMIDLNLLPGKYAYKFIVDGRWITDPNNKLREDGGSGSDNSVVFCYNHEFKLKGFKTADKVVVTGNFLNWKPKGIALAKTADGWTASVYLRDGTYAYKFIVDGRWITDPGNPVVKNDAYGNSNSFLGIGEAYTFKLDGYSNAQKVVLAGSFNNWSPTELVMDKSSKGWQLQYVIEPGNYEYKFIVDGRWMVDPANPFSTGSGDTQNSFIALKANHIFELTDYADAKQVILSGSFNGWSTKDYRMMKQGGKWIFPIYLPQGKYTYKFIVDGKWILDPINKLYEQNEYGTYNTVLWIENSK